MLADVGAGTDLSPISGCRTWRPHLAAAGIGDDPGAGRTYRGGDLYLLDYRRTAELVCGVVGWTDFDASGRRRAHPMRWQREHFWWDCGDGAGHPR